MSASDRPLITRQTLILRLKKDGPEREVAWNEFYEIYAPIIGGFARKMGAMPHEVGDLIHETLLGFFQAVPAFTYDPNRGRFRGYLKTCTWRVFRKYLKHQRLGGRRFENMDPDDVAVEQAWNDIWESEKLHRAMEIVRKRSQQRPEMSRTYEAFTMYALLERPAEEVAAKLDMSVASVHQAKTRISRTLKEVMQELEDSTG
jgi:RNA polymerase sigma-70 factor, ECF subfamily